jgi:NifU-like protein
MLEQMETTRVSEYAPPAVGADPEEMRFRAVAAVIDELRPTLQKDGGDCDLIALDGAQVKVRMKGACSGCQLAHLTLRGLEAKLTERMGRIMRVVPVP